MLASAIRGHAAGCVLFATLLGIAPAALADAETEQRVQFCRACHSPGQNVSYAPTLDGQPREYLLNQLKAFKEKRRPSDGHQRYWGPLSEQAMMAVADHFSANAPVRETFNVEPQQVAAGRAKADALGCASCHREDYTGQGGVARLAGLRPPYAAGQIRAFAAGARKHPLIDANSGISPADAEALGQYFAQVR